MRKVALFVGLGLATCAMAQAPAADQPIPYKPLESLVGGTWFASWNAATQTPSSIWGTGIRIEDWRENTIDEARRHALAAIDAYGAVLGTQGPGLGDSTFREIIGARMGRTWSFTFDQYFNGLPAIGGRVDVRVNMRGVIAMIGSTAWQIPVGFDTMPKIGEAAATAFAWMALGEEPVVPGRPASGRKPRLVIWGDVHAPAKAPFFLAWEIPIANLSQDGSGTVGRYYIDAKSGRVLRFETDRHQCGSICSHVAHVEALPSEAAPAPAIDASVAAAVGDVDLLPVPTTITVQAWTRTGLSAISPLQNIPLRNLQVNVPGIGARVTDAQGQFVIDIAAPVTITIGNLDGVHCQPVGGANAPTLSQQVQPGVAATLQLLSASAAQDVATHTSTYYWVDQVNEWSRGILGNLPAAADNVAPFVNQNGTCNAFFSSNGNSINFYPQGGSCNNTGFSTVVVHEWGHGLDNWYGGISNSNGDGLSEGWGDILGMYLVDDPTVGQNFFTNGGSIRSGNNTRMYPPPSQVHDAGEVWMGFAWRLRQNLRVSDPQNAIAISNDIVVGSIVADATNQPSAVREVFIADDDDGNLLNGVPHYSELSAAAIAKNLPYPERQVAILTHTPLTDTRDEVQSRPVFATVQPLSGTLTAIRMHYRESNGLPRIRDMVPTGQPDEYLAMLPGQLYGTSMTYHFEVTHSSGIVLRTPGTGEYSYRVAVNDSLFSEDFENGAPGWTHQMVATQDDWQLGNPAGQTGSGWTDPSSPANGNGCYGNDLGNTIGTQAWNGAYQNNVVNWLRSPSFNTTGRTGVRLRFNRWLTAESGQFDRAEIWVAGTRVWVNDLTVNHIDTSWQQFDIAIPAADNRQGVFIEWRLTTDPGLVMGGWNIDDVEVYAPGTPIVRDATLQILPEQIPPSTQVLLQVQGQPSQLALVILGTGPGPLVIPGLPDLQVGGATANFLLFLDGTGVANTILQSGPPSAATTGMLTWLHGLTFDAAGAIVATNPTQALFTP